MIVLDGGKSELQLYNLLCPNVISLRRYFFKTVGHYTHVRPWKDGTKMWHDAGIYIINASKEQHIQEMNNNSFDGETADYEYWWCVSM